MKCGQETERYEQCGLIKMWACSTSCAYELEKRFPRPITIHLSDYNSKIDSESLLLNFIDWLNSKYEETSLCKYLPDPDSRWVPIKERYLSLVRRFLQIDMKAVEADKKLLKETAARYEAEVFKAQQR